MRQETIIHVEFKNGTHLYFGSIAAIFETFTSDAVGITQASLYCFNIEPDKPYSNKICTIRKGSIKHKPGKRANGKQKSSII